MRRQWMGSEVSVAAAVCVLLLSLSGCQGSDVRVGFSPVSTSLQSIDASVGSGPSVEPTCFADSECAPLADSPCSRAVCNAQTRRCELGIAPDNSACESADLCAQESVCLSGVCRLLKQVQCSDDNPCTTDSCDPSSGCVFKPTTDAACSDGNPCTIDDLCVDGTCQAATNICSCSADQDCSASSTPCTGPLTCVEGDCQVNLAAAVTCDDANPCTHDECDPTSGDCVFVPKSDNTPCVDDDLCSVGERCIAGSCLRSAQLPCSLNEQRCATAICDSKAGCVAESSADGTPCDDGNACTLQDTCKRGVCAGPSTCECSGDDDCDGQLPLCLGSLRCVVGRCEVNPATAVPCADAGPGCVVNFCTGKGCELFTSPDAAPCNDGTLCTVGDRCNDTAVCEGGAALNCDDGNPCTNDVCSSTAGCEFAIGFSGTPCDDGNPCTDSDSCQGASCRGVSTQCEDDDPCTDNYCSASGDSCVSLPKAEGSQCDDGQACSIGDRCVKGLCVPLTIQQCDDNDPCTDDICGGILGCEHPSVANGQPCDDGDLCTNSDVCIQGGCQGTPGGCDCKSNADCASLDDGNLCNGVMACLGNQCTVDPDTIVVCPASDKACVVIACDPQKGLCSESAATVGESCDDGDACTKSELCLTGGVCGGGEKVGCEDDDLCTVDSCDSGLGCLNLPAAATLAKPCDDGNACTQGDVCDQGGCKAGVNTCQCTKNSECGVFDDGNLCNGSLICVKGACVSDGKKVNCDAIQVGPCESAACQPSTGACSVIAQPNGSSCATGVGCGILGTCSNKLCVPNSTTPCDDANPCTVDSCSAQNACVNTVQLNLSCDDGDPCTPSSACDATGACVGKSNICLCKTDQDCPDDGDSCNGTLQCQAGVCQPKPGSVVVCNGSSNGPCQSTACDPGTGLCKLSLTPNGVACDDGSACTTGTTCVSGTCSGGSVPNCDDSNPCTDDGCNPVNGCYQNANTKACDDGNPCTKGDTCGGGICLAGTGTCQCQSDVDCAGQDDGNPCNGTIVCEQGSCKTDPASVVTCDAAKDTNCLKNLCALSTGVCKPTALPDGTACDDGTVCTGSDACASGVCAGKAGSCDDGNTCTDDSCNATLGCQFANNQSTCDDGNPCTDKDACSAGSCGGQTLLCNDGNPCTDDTCDLSSGCVAVNNNAACDDGNACTANDTCSNGACNGGVKPCDDNNPCTDDVCSPQSGCQSTNNTQGCDDGNACTDNDKCGAGVCVGGTAISCNDSNPCTDDSCSPATGCVFANNTLKCDDGDACTTVDQCSGGLCKGANNPCDDGNLCTTDSCDAGSGCKSAPNTASCDDGDPCTTTDTCSNGACTGGAPVGCDDGNPCTTDSCTKGVGCAFANNAAACDDGDACTTKDVCKGGTCAGAALVCDDSNACTDDSCSADTGCVATANTASCDDGDGCTTQDTCSGGACTGGVPTNCDDGNQCTDDSCAAGACVNQANTASCEDGDPCTKGDTCKAGACVAGPKSVQCCAVDADCNDSNACTTDKCTIDQCSNVGIVCNDSNPCTTDSCDPAVGCKTTPAAGLCDDGDACTVGDVCSAGQCQSGFKINCDDGNVCTADSCGASGCINTATASVCDDGNACTNPDQCVAGKCQGSAVQCDDGNVCTTDFCDINKGCSTVNNSGACTDGDACTSDDVCSGGKCVGKTVDCDDDNPCTVDSCGSTGCVNTALANGTNSVPGVNPLCDNGFCFNGACSPGSDVTPGLSCKDIRDKLPGAKTGPYFIDPSGGGSPYEVQCDMDRFGGGWMVVKPDWINANMTMKTLTVGGKCTLSATEIRTWDGFDGATADSHYCVVEPKTGLVWPTYQEIRIDAVVLTGYTAGAGNTYDAYSDCYGASWQGNFCVGPSTELKPVNNANIQLGNNQNSPTYNLSYSLSQPRSDFQIRSREEGPQDEGIVWDTGAILLR
ncbi:MAG: hypothetical protein CMH53_09495 [Myxococcales bacterium]|nr:hypothetical protein [Myxococcales bacterium]